MDNHPVATMQDDLADGRRYLIGREVPDPLRHRWDHSLPPDDTTTLRALRESGVYGTAQIRGEDGLFILLAWRCRR